MMNNKYKSNNVFAHNGCSTMKRFVPEGDIIFVYRQTGPINSYYNAREWRGAKTKWFQKIN